MKVYRINDLFLFSGSTFKGHPYLAIGKGCRDDQAMLGQLKHLLDNFQVPSLCSPGKLDRLLASALQKLNPQPFLIGCTIAVPGISGSGGGVLGSPQMLTEQAKGEMERMPGGWKLLTFPGSPGLAFKEGVEGAFCPAINPADPLGQPLLLKLAAQAYHSGVEEFLALTDGSGPQADGSAIIQKGRDYVVCSLD